VCFLGLMRFGDPFGHCVVCVFDAVCAFLSISPVEYIERSQLSVHRLGPLVDKGAEAEGAIWDA
jgi:hypothetical protein